MTTTLQTRETLIDGPFGAVLLLQTGGFSVVEHPIAPRTLAAPAHVHQHEDEYSYVAEGEVGFEIGDETFAAGPGQLVAKPRGIWHAFWNRSDEPARLLEIISPAGFERYFDEISQAPPPARAEIMARYGLTMDFDSIEVISRREGLPAPGAP